MSKAPNGLPDDALLREAEILRRKSEKPAKPPKWLPAVPAHLQLDIEDTVVTRVKVMAVVNKTTVSHIVNLLLCAALAARGDKDLLL